MPTTSENPSPSSGFRKGKEDIVDEVRRVAPSQVNAGEALAAVMCAFTQRLTQGEARHLLTDLPVEDAAFFAACVLHRDEPAAGFDRSWFLQRVAEHLNLPVEEAEPFARKVLSLVQRRLSPEVVAHIASQLPADLELLWREASALPLA